MDQSQEEREKERESWQRFLGGIKMITLDFDPDRYWSDREYAEEVQDEFMFGKRRIKDGE